MNIKAYLKDKGQLVNDCLVEYFGRPNASVPKALSEAMRYSLMAGGKRLRPILTLATYEACGGDGREIVHCATALEVIHTYSLIHDDLPAMDNDDLRRGKPTNHKVYGEAIAILAGDGLLSEAFLMMMEVADRVPLDCLFNAMREVAIASGPGGMVGGQVEDMLAENAEPNAERLLYIHKHKTGALIAASVKIGGMLKGADARTMDALSVYGMNLGLAFQIVDDILDLQGDEAVIGKPVGSDLKKNKLTYPALFGLDESRRRAETLIAEGVDAISWMPRSAEPLRAIADYIVRRNH